MKLKSTPTVLSTSYGQTLYSAPKIYPEECSGVVKGAGESDSKWHATTQRRLIYKAMSSLRAEL